MADSTHPPAPEALAATIQDGPEASPDAPVARGTMIGHFIAIESIGAGAMGTVLLAYDPALDRKVALKLLRLGAWSASATTEGKQRLLREAQAMAKLSHPNVVTAYEVGTLGERVFLAMEYVAGKTLGAWLEERPRSWREVVEVFRQAGRGLAAAHAAKIVHRDFKPENVLISSDGRVRVSDFGLASMVGAPHAEEPAPDATPAGSGERGAGTEPSRASGPSTLTRAGAVIGTPAYMSPEQHRGEVADARADQFAFAVALYEALHGERPFAGSTYREYAEAVLAGRVREAPRGSKVPGWLRRVVLRALSVEPDARFAYMDDLLVALADDPGAQRRRWMAVGGFGLIVVAAAGSVFWLSGRKDELCAPSQRTLAGVWDAGRRVEVERAFVASGRPGATETAARVARILDGRAAALVGMRSDACRATHTRGEQSSELLDLRIACLDRKTTELRALVDVFAQKPDPIVIDNAVEAALSVGKPEPCADAQALNAAVPPPADEPSRIAIALTREKLARVEALANTGKYKEGHELVQQAVADAEKVKWTPLLADAVAQLALMESRIGKLDEAEASWRRVIRLAAEAKNDVLLATGWAFLMHTVGYGQQRHEEAAVLEEIAVVQAKRAGEPPGLMADLDNAIGTFRYARGDYAGAKDLFEKLKDARVASLGADHPLVAAAMANLASVVGDMGDYPRQLALTQEALAIRERILGPDHPQTAQSLNTLGIALDHLGRTDEALAAFQRALAICEKVFGPEAVPTADRMSSVALVLEDQGKLDEALALHQKALAIKEKIFGPDHPNLTNSLNNLAGVYEEMGDLARARALRERVLSVREKALGPDHPDVAATLNNLSIVVKKQGDFDGSRKLLDRVLDIRVKRLGADHPDVGNTMNNIAFLELERGRLDEADRWYRKAIPILENKLGADHQRVLDTLLYFGETQAQRKNYAEAIEVWQRALDGYAKYHPGKLTATAKAQIEEAIAKARAALPRAPKRRVTE